MAWNLTGTARDVRAARACAPSDAPDGEGAPRALSVSEAMGFAKGALESRTLVVEGEVSEFNDKPGYKAAYFTIADASSPMSCMMWRNRYLASGVELRVGEKVRVTGRFTVYVPKGRMQFEVFSLAPAGEGDLRQRVDRLARKLEAQGLMDPARKRPIPRFCQRVAVVTSPRGKAVHDVMRTLRRRNPLVELLVCGVAVEGADAPAHIIEGLRVAAQARPDAILLVRGGGSYEDLMPFNDEQLARAVAACPVPVVTGIGHEPDTTICDMVGDLRCSTPTAAAESVAPSCEELSSQLRVLGTRLGSALHKDLGRRAQALDALASRPVLAQPARTLVQPLAESLDLAHDRLVRAIPDALEARRAGCLTAAQRLSRAGATLTAAHGARLEFAARQLAGSSRAMLDAPRRTLAVQAGRLDALSPLAVIARGYAMASDADGHVVSSVSQARVGQALDVRVSDGVLACEVRGVTSEPCASDGRAGRVAARNDACDTTEPVPSPQGASTEKETS